MSLPFPAAGTGRAFDDAALLALHRALVATPSVSGAEGPLCTALLELLARAGVPGERHGDNLFALAGTTGPLLAFNSHLDTVPASPAWTRDPYAVAVVDGRVYGLGSNDAKASAAALTAAFLRVAPEATRLGIRLLLTLSAQEEVGGKGSEALVGELARRGLEPDAVVVGEPTALEIAIAQKGLLVLELRARGDACHAAHGHALGARNAIRALARDLVALDAVPLGPPHPTLGPVTLQPTVLAGGTARNMVPVTATCLLDVRTNPHPSQRATFELLRAACAEELALVSDRLAPYEIAADHPLVRAALRARPAARLFGSRGLSDLVFFRCPGIKVGPGVTERSHTADEFVLESEIREGAAFYEALARAFAAPAVPAGTRP